MGQSRVARTTDVGLVPMTRVANAMILRNHVAEGEFDSGEKFSISLSMDGRFMVEFDDDDSGTYYYVSPQDLLENACEAWQQRVKRVSRVKGFVNRLQEGS